MLIQKAEVKVQTAKLLACPSAESLWASDPISGEVTHGGFPVEADQRAEQRQDCLLSPQSSAKIGFCHHGAERKFASVTTEQR